MALTTFTPPKDAPKCPRCGLAPWRENRGVVLEARTEDGEEEERWIAECCVCRHCSSIWALDRDAWAWRPLTDEEWKIAAPHLIPISMKFTEQRLRLFIGFGLGDEGNA